MFVFTIHLFVGSVTSGIAVVAALLFGATTLVPLLAAGAFGFAVAFPISWIIARKIGGL